MARKVYRTKNGITSYSIGLVMPDGKSKVYAQFNGGVSHPRFIPSTYETESLNEQNALEKHASFNKKFELMPAPVGKKAPAQQPVAGETEGFKVLQNTTIQSAVTTLQKQGWTGNPDELVTVEDVQEAGKTVGVLFPKLK